MVQTAGHSSRRSPSRNHSDQSRSGKFDAYANAYFYTDNTSYRGAEVLRQEPLPGLEGHISYSFTNNVWASIDTRYSFRGDTLVNGINQNNSQQNFILGSELNVSLNGKNTLIFEFGEALVHQNGPAVRAFAVKYDYTWGKGYKWITAGPQQARGSPSLQSLRQ